MGTSSDALPLAPYSFLLSTSSIDVIGDIVHSMKLILAIILQLCLLWTSTMIQLMAEVARP